MNLTGDPTLYLFAGSNGAGKTTFARAYLRQLDPIRRIRQRVKMGGHSIPEADVRRRFPRSLDHFLEIYAPLADGWTFRDNSTQPAALLFDSANSPPSSKSKTSYPNETAQDRSPRLRATRLHCLRPGRRQSYDQETPRRTQTLESFPSLLERRQNRRHQTMKPEDRYHRFVRWSDEDQCYIGYCPDHYYGVCCHGDQEEQTNADLCAIVRDEIAHRLAKGETLPTPAAHAPPHSGNSSPPPKNLGKAVWRATLTTNENRREFSRSRQIPASSGAFILASLHPFSFQHFSFTQIPLFPRNPLFPRLRSGHRLFQWPYPKSNFLAVMQDAVAGDADQCDT